MAPRQSENHPSLAHIFRDALTEAMVSGISRSSSLLNFELSSVMVQYGSDVYKTAMMVIVLCFRDDSVWKT